MTFRAKPTRTGRRSGHESDARRNLYFNLGFGAVIVAAVLLLVGAAAASWYDEHLAPVARVNGETITKDGLRERVAIETFRLDTLESRTREKVNAGRMSQAQGQQLLNFVAEQKQDIGTYAYDREIDTTLILQLGATEGVEITEAAIDAQIQEDATTPESRHTFMIEVAPETSPGAVEPTPEQVDAARKKADDLRAQLESGTSWEDVVKASGDADAAESNGDLFFLDEGSTSPDVAFVEAIFALEAPGYIDVVEGADGIFRIGRMTEVAPEVVDPNYLKRAADAGVNEEAYRRVASSIVARDELEAKVLAEVVDAPSEQRRTAEMVVDDNDGLPLAENAVLVKHLLYAPGDDPNAAAELEADDPAWATAEAEARKAYEDLSAGTSRFVDLAPDSDDAGSAAQNGFLGYYDPSSGLDEAFAAAIFAEGLEDGELLEPVRSQFGWHVIQIVTRDEPAAWAASLAAEAAKAGTDFAALAADNSIAPSAVDGGDLGWVARYQLDADREDLVFATQANSVSEIVPLDGLTFFKVDEIANRMPDEAQAQELRDNAFVNWYIGIRNDPEQTTIENLLEG
jgi:parvulin-like peptidyl-prolyl isomerase